MATLFREMPSMATLLTMYTSISTMTMPIRTVVNKMIPSMLRNWFTSMFENLLFSKFASNFTVIIEDRWQAVNNGVFHAVGVYLPTTRRLLLGNNNSNNITSPPKPNIPVNGKVANTFCKAHLDWTLREEEERNKYCPRNKKYFELRCKKHDRELVMDSYLPYICKQAEEILNQRETLNIYTYEHDNYSLRCSSVEAAIIARIQVTPAEIAQQLMMNDNSQVVLESLVEFFNFKRNDAEKSGSKKDEEEINEEVVKCVKDEKGQPERWDNTDVKFIYFT